MPTSRWSCRCSGVALSSDELAFGEGLALIRPEAIDHVPEEAAWDGETPNALVYVTGEEEGVAADAAARARRVVTALRLYDAARVALGPAAWIRTAGGRWQAVATGSGGRPDGILVVAGRRRGRAARVLQPRLAPDPTPRRAGLGVAPL